MFWLKNLRSGGMVLATVVLLSACSTVVFPEITEEDQANTGGEIVQEENNFEAEDKVLKPMPEEGKSLKADQEHVAYEGEDEALRDNVDLTELAESDDDIDPAEVTPVIKADIDGDTQSEEIVAPVTASSQAAEDDDVPSVTYRLDTFYFDNGSAVLDSKYNAQIRQIVKAAKQDNAMIKVVGYASSRTRNTDIVSHKLANFNISLQRAQSVAAALRRAGLKADRIEVEALSDTAPMYKEVMPEGERLKRRAEVYIFY